MKHGYCIKTLGYGCLISLLPLLTHAAEGTSTLTATDVSGSTSFNAKGNWSGGLAPGPGTNFFTSTFGLRTPVDGYNYTFAGNSLTLQPGTTSGYSLLYKGDATNSLGGNVYTINNFTNAGGLIRSGAGSGNTCIFAGTMFITAAGGIIQADQSPFVVSANVSGGNSSVLTNLNPANQTYGTVTYSGTNSAFTGELLLGANAIVVFTNIFSAPGNPSVSNPGQITLLAAATLLDYAGVSLTNSNGGLTLEGNATINVSATNAGTATTVSEPITDNGGGYVLTKRGAGILVLSGTNTFGGGLTLYGSSVGSQLDVNNPFAIGTGTFTVNNGNNALLDNTSGGLVVLTNNNAQTWGNDFTFIGTGSLNMGNGSVTMSGNRNITVSNNTFTVGPVTDNGSYFSLTKNGAGTLALNGGGSYYGSTVINDGVLAVIGSGSSLDSTNITLGAASATLDVTGTGGFTLAASQVLAGTGTVAGLLTDGSATLILPGGATTAGTLTVNGNLTLAGSGTVNFDLSTNTATGGGTNSLIVVTGTLNIGGTTPITISGQTGTGTYTLFQYGTFAGSVGNLTVSPGFVITNNTAAKAIQLFSTHVPVNLTWLGDGSVNAWDVGVTTNWLQSGTNQYFYEGDFVTFNNTGSDSPSIALTGSISPGSTTVNATQTYDFTGSGILSGNLTKSGSGTLILENNNTYPGPTVINAGVLQLGNGGNTGSVGAGPVTNNAALVFDQSASDTVPNNISGTGTLNVAGGADLYLTGSNSYSGQTIITAGTLHPENGSALGLGTAGLVNINGGNLYVDLNINFPTEPLTLGGYTVALEKGGAGVSTLGGTVTLDSDATFSVDTGATLDLTNATGINGVSAGANLTLAGGGAGNFTGPVSLGTGNLTVNGGTWTVAATNRFSGLTTINGGTLLLSGPLSLSQPPASFNASQVTLNGGALGVVTNVTLADGNIGITLNANATISVVNTNNTFTISNDISGGSTLIKSGPGRLVLSGANDFSGTLNVDTASTSANDGTTVIANNAAIANLSVSAGSPSIYIGDNNGGSSTLALDGTLGPITVAPDISLTGRNVAVQAIENIAGSNTISGNLTLVVGGGLYEIQSDSGILTLSAPLPYATPTSSGRTFTFLGAGDIAVTGGIQDGSNNGITNVWDSVIEDGPGLLDLSATNTYSGSTVVSNGVLYLTGGLGTGPVTVAGGLLVGTGTLLGPVTVQSAGSVEAGTTNATGTLNFSNTLALAGNTIVKINQARGANDLFSGETSVTYGGTLTVTNLAGTLALGNQFKLFTASSASGSFSSLVGSAGPGLAYSFNPTNGVLSIVTGIASNPTNLTFHVTGATLAISWPADHLGWILQSQTNTLGAGLGTNWVDINGSSAATSNNATITPTNPTVFFRLRHP
jgi:autotransporter-associated beta strand protein